MCMYVSVLMLFFLAMDGEVVHTSACIILHVLMNTLKCSAHAALSLQLAGGVLEVS